MQQYGGWTVSFLSLNTCKEAHPPPEYTEKTAMRKHNLNTQFPLGETDRHVTTGSRFPKCLLLLGTSVCNFPCISCFLHYPSEMHTLWSSRAVQRESCCYDRTPRSTLGNLLQAPESCGSGARSTGNSQNECQNDLAVPSCLKHLLSSREMMTRLWHHQILLKHVRTAQSWLLALTGQHGIA